MTGSDYARDSGFGSSTNRTKFDDNGTMTMEGSATVWEDIATSLIGSRLNSTAGTVDYDYAENAVAFGPNGGITDVNDTVHFNIQLPHATKEDSALNLHMHWEQTDSTDREFTVEYRIQDNGDAKTTSWTQAVVGTNANNVFTYTSGTLNQIADLVSVDLTGVGISATVQFKMTRSDAIAGDLLVTFVDAHYEMDMLGSNTEYAR